MPGPMTTTRTHMLAASVAALMTSAFVSAALIAGSGTLHAQERALPGLIVTIPRSEPVDPPKAEEPKAAPKREPRQTQQPKATSKPRAKSASTGTGQGSSGRKPHKIALLVNDDPITNFEIDARARLLALNSDISSRAKQAFAQIVRNPRTNERLKAIFQEVVEANRGRSRDEIIAIFEKRKSQFAKGLQQQALSSARASVIPGLRKRAEDELIEERLKLQEARSLGITVDDAQAEQIFGDIAKRNNLSAKQFEAQLRSSGVDPASMKERFKSGLAWNMVIRRRFSRLVSVNQAQIDEFLGENTTAGGETIALHKITFKVPDSLDQTQVAQQFRKAEGVRRRFKSCADTQSLAAAEAGARFEDLGKLASSKIEEPTRSMVLAARSNEMLPPTIASDGIVLYAVCSKAGDDDALAAEARARQKLQQEEFDIRAKRHLADLKRDAHIERR